MVFKVKKAQKPSKNKAKVSADCSENELKWANENTVNCWLNEPVSKKCGTIVNKSVWFEHKLPQSRDLSKSLKLLKKSKWFKDHQIFMGDQKCCWWWPTEISTGLVRKWF